MSLATQERLLRTLQEKERFRHRRRPGHQH